MDEMNERTFEGTSMYTYVDYLVRDAKTKAMKLKIGKFRFAICSQWKERLSTCSRIQHKQYLDNILRSQLCSALIPFAITIHLHDQISKPPSLPRILEKSPSIPSKLINAMHHRSLQLPA